MPSNSFITPQVVAREALRLLQSNILVPLLTSRRYQAEFSQNGQKVGDTINIRRRVKGVVQEFNGSNGNNQTDIVESQIPMTLERHFDAGIAVSAKDYTLELETFSEQIIAPYITEMAEKIDTYGLSKLLHIPNVAGPSESAPAALPNSIAAMALVDKTANDLKFPNTPRYQIISPEYKATLLGVDSFVEVDKSGADNALRQAQFNRIMGFNSFMGQNVPTATHTSGTQTTFVTNGTTAVGATSLVVDGAAVAAGTLVGGDIVNIAGYGNVTVGAAGVTFAANAATIPLQEPIRNTGAGAVAIADGAACVTYDGGGNDRQCHGAIFHPDAMAFASVPLALPQSVPAEYIQDPATGLGMRVVYDYDRATKSDVINLDFLCGMVISDPRLAAQIVKDG